MPIRKPRRLQEMRPLGPGSDREVIRRSSSIPLADTRETPKRITPPAALAGRNGFDRKFIAGFDVAVPRPGASWKDDLVKLKAGGTGHELSYRNFSVVMSRSRKLALFVATNIDGKLKKKQPRTDVWYLDGRIPEGDQIGEFLYAQNDLDRGHLVRREDPVWGVDAKQANLDTFHFTNCAPQHKDMNQKTWLGLEDYILRNAQADGMRVSVFGGPVLAGNDRLYRKVKIPSRYWKVVAFIGDTGRQSATAYLLSQADLISDLEFTYGPYKTYQVAISRIEQLCGLSFGKLKTLDGFSTEESMTRRSQAREIRSLSDIMV